MVILMRENDRERIANAAEPKLLILLKLLCVQ